MSYQTIYGLDPIEIGVSVPQYAKRIDDYEASVEVNSNEFVKIVRFPKSTASEAISNVRIHINYYTTGTRTDDNVYLEAVDKDGMIGTESYTFVSGDFGGDDSNHKEISLVLTDSAWKDWDVIDQRLQVQCRGQKVKGGDRIIVHVDALWLEVDYTPIYTRSVFYCNNSKHMEMTNGVFVCIHVVNPRCGWLTSAGYVKKYRGLFSFDTSPLPNNAFIETVRLYVRAGTDYSDYENFNNWVFRYNWPDTPTEIDWDNITPFNSESGEYEGNLANTAGITEYIYHPSVGLNITLSWINKTGNTRLVIKSSTEGNATGIDNKAYIDWGGDMLIRQATLVVEYSEVPPVVQDLRKTIDDGIVTKLVDNEILTKMVKGS